MRLLGLLALAAGVGWSQCTVRFDPVLGQLTCPPTSTSVVSGGSLTSTAVVTGGGGTTLQTPSATTTLDSSGNLSTPGTISSGVGGSAAGSIQLTQGTAPSLGTTAITLHAPASVTSYRVIFPSAAATGLRFLTNASNVVTESVITGGSSGQVLTSNGASAPSWAAATGGGGTSGWSGLPLTFASTTTQYGPYAGGGLPSATETAVSTKASGAATISNLHVTIDAALGADVVFTVTLENGTATASALTCSTSAGGTSCDDITHSVSVADQALLSWKLVKTSGTVTAGLPQIKISYAVGTSGVGTTSVSFTGGLISVATATTTPALTVAGTSGGVPYFSGATTWASSGAMGAGQFMLGGGAGASPTTSFSVVPVANGGSGIASAASKEITFTASCDNATASPLLDRPTASATTTTCFGTTTTQGAEDFVDASTTGGNIHFRLPAGWTGALDVTLGWFANASSANAVRWSVATGCVADSEAISTGPSYNAASATNAAYTGTANQRQTTTLSAVAVTNCSAGETVYVQVQRIGANAGDTLTATAELLEMTVVIRVTPQV